MNTGVRILLFGLAFCACIVLAGSFVDAEVLYGVDLELKDTAPVQTAKGRDTLLFEFTIEHNGTNATEEIVISIKNVSQGWQHVLHATTRHDHYSEIDSMAILLESGEVALLNVTITPPFDPGLNMTHWFGVNATVSQDITANETVYIGVAVPRSVDLQFELEDPPPNATYQSIPPSTVTISYVLYNLGNAPDTFLIQSTSTRPGGGWTMDFHEGVDESGHTDELVPDINKENPYHIVLKVSIPAGEAAGNESVVTVTARSLSNASHQEPPAVATVRAMQYYNFQVYIDGPDAKEGVPGENVMFQLRIINSGNGYDDLSMEVLFDEELNPGFVAYPTPSNITIPGNGTGDVWLVVEVPENAPHKVYHFSLEVRSSSPELAPVTKSFKVEVGQYFGVELSCDDPSRETVPGGNLEFELRVANTGNGLDSFVVQEVEGLPQGWLTYVQPPELTLLQYQNATVKVVVIVPSQFEDAPHRVHTATVVANSSRSAAGDRLELTVDIGQVWRIEWMYQGEELTNPARPVAQPGSVSPRPEIDLLNETTTTVVLAVRNYGNVDDTVTLQLENDLTRYQVSVEPMEFTLEGGESQDVTVTLTVPRDLVGGVYVFSLMAASSNGSVLVRTVHIHYEIVPVYSADDFEPLQYVDDPGDDYAFTFTAEEAGGSVTRSRGRLHRAGNVDFLNLNADIDMENGTVVVTLIFEDGPLDDPATEYWVYFVDEDHRQGGPLLRPGVYNEGEFNWTFSDQAHTLVGLWYSGGEWGSTGNLTVLEVGTTWNGMNFNISSRELRREGVDPGSGFGVYAYAQTLTRSTDGDYRMRVVWDSAGLGAARPPAEFTNEPEDTPAPAHLAPLALVAAAATLVVLVGAGRRRREGPQ